MLIAHGATHRGRRPSNEDSFLVDPELGLLVVADGMGGHNAGEVASRVAVDAIVEFMRISRDAGDLTWPYGIDPALSLQANRLRTAVRMANARVLAAAAGNVEYSGMGTTVVAALVQDDDLSFASVGDSRVYVHSAGTLSQLTEDDSWVAAVLSRDPAMTEKDIAAHPMRHVLTSVVGARDGTEARIGERTLHPGDTVILCSDGVHGVLTGDQIAAALSTPGDLPAIADVLVRSALDAGGTDNVTVVLARRS